MDIELTEDQKNIVANIGKAAPAKKAKGKPKKEVEPKGPTRFVSSPGYSVVGLPNFPFETEDPAIISEVKKSRGYRIGKIWVETRTIREQSANEKALEKLGLEKLRRMVSALGYGNISQYRKYELMDILVKEGF
jgi:hypothetical protein